MHGLKNIGIRIFPDKEACNHSKLTLEDTSIRLMNKPSLGCSITEDSATAVSQEACT